MIDANRATNILARMNVLQEKGRARRVQPRLVPRLQIRDSVYVRPNGVAIECRERAVAWEEGRVRHRSKLRVGEVQVVRRWVQVRVDNEYPSRARQKAMLLIRT